MVFLGSPIVYLTLIIDASGFHEELEEVEMNLLPMISSDFTVFRLSQNSSDNVCDPKNSQDSGIGRSGGRKVCEHCILHYNFPHISENGLVYLYILFSLWII